MPQSALPKTTVIIPFFQRKKGLLTACVQSVLAQTDVSNVRVIVVDDGSPISAADELAETLEQTSNVVVILQANAGPGAARNRGLDSVDPDTNYVAFLDSDDLWEADFLAIAYLAFDRGCDLFFANTRRYGVDKTRFEWGASTERKLEPSAHTGIDVARGLYEFRGDFFDYAIVRSSIISTSTMVYRYSKFPDIRFNDKLFNGQDRLFKLMVSKVALKVGFSTKVCANEGRGVNIFDSSGWGSQKSLNLITNYIRLSKYILKEVDLNAKQAAHVQSQLDESRFSFSKTLLHLLRTGVKVDWRVVFRTFSVDPVSAAMFVPNVTKIIAGKLRSPR